MLLSAYRSATTVEYVGLAYYNENLRLFQTAEQWRSACDDQISRFH